MREDAGPYISGSDNDRSEEDTEHRCQSRLYQGFKEISLDCIGKMCKTEDNTSKDQHRRCISLL